MIDWKSWLMVASEFFNLRTKVNQIMSGLDDVTASVKAAEARLDGVVTTVEGLRTTVANLQAQIGAQPDEDPALEALAAELSGHVAAFDAALNPPAPAADPATSTVIDTAATTISS